MSLLEIFFTFDAIYTYQQCQDQYVSCKIQATQIISTINHSAMELWWNVSISLASSSLSSFGQVSGYATDSDCWIMWTMNHYHHLGIYGYELSPRLLAS
jgi:hypothetical protein